MGGFDEELFLYEEEADLFLPARRMDADVRYCAEAVVTHVHGHSVEQSGLGEFSRLQAYRSKYYLFRKHYGPVRARMVFESDCAVFHLSSVMNRLRGSESEARRRLEVCREAYRQSFVPIEELRKGY